MSTDDDNKSVAQLVEQPLVVRDDKGRFVKGYSGNPAGKPQGIKHRATLIKETIDASMADMLHEDFIEIMEKALALAKKGDKQMIKLLLTDFLAEVRRAQSDEGGRGTKITQINIRNYTMPNEEKTVYEHGSIEGEAGNTDE